MIQVGKGNWASCRSEVGLSRPNTEINLFLFRIGLITARVFDSWTSVSNWYLNHQRGSITGHDRLLRSGTLSLKLGCCLLKLLNLAFLLRLTHRLVLLLGGRLGHSARAFSIPHLLLDCCFNLRSMLHNQPMDLPEGRCADKVDVKLKSTVLTYLHQC